MNKLIPVAAAVVALIAVAVLFAQIRGAMQNGEVPNPNVGKPSKNGAGRGLSRQAADNMDKETYKQFLKRNRPDLSDAELDQKADAWWRIKSGG